MGKKLLHMALAVIAAVLPTIPSMAQIPEGYYNSLKGKKGAELKTAVYNVIKNAKVLSYGSGSGHTWWGFWQTDRDLHRGWNEDYIEQKQERHLHHQARQCHSQDGKILITEKARILERSFSSEYSGFYFLCTDIICPIPPSSDRTKRSSGWLHDGSKHSKESK